jgi:hypothetical protein
MTTHKRHCLLYLAIIWSCLLFCGNAFAQSPTPNIKLDASLARIFSISHCEWISGLTCKISYNGKGPLPSEIFFVELDAKGKTLGPQTRLLYPHLTTGETGRATFRINVAAPASLVLSAKWDGAWRSPY